MSGELAHFAFHIQGAQLTKPRNRAAVALSLATSQIEEHIDETNR
jgi:hypothetical protein